MSDFIAAKLAWAIFLIVAVGLAAFFYGLFTGKDLSELFQKRPHDPPK